MNIEVTGINPIDKDIRYKGISKINELPTPVIEVLAGLVVSKKLQDALLKHHKMIVKMYG